MSTTLEQAVFPDLGKGQCIALTTFRRTGQGVTTPVWFASGPSAIYVETHADAGKRKRLRHTAHVTLAPCDYSGKVTGPTSEGTARIVTAPEECARAATALAKKYGALFGLFHFVRDARLFFERKVRTGSVYIAIEPIAG